MMFLDGCVLHSFSRSVYRYKSKEEEIFGSVPQKTPTSCAATLQRLSVFMWARRSVRQSLSALCASSLQDISAVSSLHSLSEAMLLFSLTLFRLIRSQHLTAPPFVVLGSGSLCHSHAFTQ